MSRALQLSRRTVLRGLGTAMALPLLDAMESVAVLADDGSAKPSPKRMAFIYVPNGMHMPDWTPKEAGGDFELPFILEPLKPHRNDMLVLSGLADDKACAHGDGGGDHARALASFLTGIHPRKTNGSNLQAGVSVDQVAAEQIGRETKFPSLELGCDRGALVGSCDSGYSCAYSTNISWRSDVSPVLKEADPRLAFERLFCDESGAGDTAYSIRRRYRKSILDFVLEDANDLQRKLGGKDRRKVDEYLASVSEIEQRISRAEKDAHPNLPEDARPAGIPREYAEHLRIMYDLIALAFQTDVTRISTFVVANEGSNRSYPFIDVPDGHHDLSHHGGDAEKQAKIRLINRFHAEQFARFVGRLSAIREGERSLLDNSMILFGSGIADGDAHNHENLPILLLGRGGGTIDSGRHLRFDHETPLTNLFLSMLDRMDCKIDQFGDSTGRLDLNV